MSTATFKAIRCLNLVKDQFQSFSFSSSINNLNHLIKISGQSQTRSGFNLKQADKTCKILTLQHLSSLNLSERIIFARPYSTSMAPTPIRPIVISGPSGSGKSTLLNRLMAEFPGCFAFSVSHTTRKPRAGEEDGVAYHFVTMDEFQKLVADDGFLEHAQFSGNCYGTSKKSVEDISRSGQLCVLDVEINGVKSIKQSTLSPTPRFIFVKPPNMEELRKRLESRGSETPESLQKRMDTVQEAIDYSNEPGSYDHIIVNDQLDVAYEHFKGILIEDINAVQNQKLKKGE